MLLTVHARAEHTLSERPRFTDPAAVELVSRLDYDFTMARQDRLMADGVVLRTLTLDPLVAGYLDTHPGCTVVNIACGLDTRFQRLDDGRVTWYDLDLPDVIALRRRLLEDGERHRTIAASALDPDWPDQLEDMSRDVLVIIEGLSMYLEQEEVRMLLDIIAARLPGATVLIVHGDQDRAVPIEVSRAAASATPDAELVTIPGAAHGFGDANWEEAMRRTIGFLAWNGVLEED